MTLAVNYPHIEKMAGGSARLRRLPRIRVAQVAMDYLAHGWSADEMCRQHPGLTPAEAHAAMMYYFDHQAEIDAEIEQEWQAVRQEKEAGRRSPFFQRLRAQGVL